MIFKSNKILFYDYYYFVFDYQYSFVLLFIFHTIFLMIINISVHLSNFSAFQFLLKKIFYKTFTNKNLFLHIFAF